MAACGGASDGETGFSPEANLNVNPSSEVRIIDAADGTETISTPKSVLLSYTVGFNYNADDSEALFFAIEAINDVFGFEMLTVVDFNEADIQVTQEDLDGAKMGLAYVYDGPACNVMIDFEAVHQWKIVAHELLHCVGFGHSDNWPSLMHANNADGDFTNQMVPLYEDTLEENHIEATENKALGYHADDENMEPTLFED